MLTKTAACEYRSSSCANSTNGFAYWLKAVKYLLWTHAADSTICEATENLENIRPHTNETENSYAYRIGDAAYRCGNVHSDNEKIIIFTKLLLPSVCQIVERFRREQPRYGLTFNRIVAFALGGGDYKRVTNQSKTTVRCIFPTNTRNFARAHISHAIGTTRTNSQLAKRVVSIMEQTN